MKTLFEYIQLNEDAKKDRLMDVKSVSDKIHKAIMRIQDGNYYVNLDDLERRGWYVPGGKLEKHEWEILMAWSRKDQEIFGERRNGNRKNPATGKRMGTWIDDTTHTSLIINCVAYMKGEDEAESIAAELNVLFDVMDEEIGVPAKKRIDVDKLVKEIRKEWLGKYNELPCPPDPEQRRAMRAAMMNLHGDFSTMSNGTYSMGYDR